MALYDPVYRPSTNSNFTFGKSGTEPDGYDFIEDGQRFFENNSYNRSFTGFNDYSRSIRMYSSAYQGNNSWKYQYYYLTPSKRGRVFYFFLKRDPDADTFYIQNHGFRDSSSLTFTKNSGDDPKFRSDTGTTYNTAPTYTTVVLEQHII